MILNDPAVQAALQAVQADQDQHGKDTASEASALKLWQDAKRIAENSREHLGMDVQALYESIEAATGIPPKATLKEAR